METPLGEELGRRIREGRDRRGWSLADVAARAGLSRAYINVLERGRGRRPGADALRRLEDVLGPLREPPTFSQEVPPGLQQLAEERNLPTAEVVTLASLRVGGRQPVSQERWRFIYDALVTSESLDASAAQGDRRTAGSRGDRRGG